MLLLHGFTGSHANWQDVLPTLAADHRVIAVDLLGHGQTDAPDDPARYAMPHAAADLAALMTALSTEEFHLLGYSMGGRLALFTALAYPAGTVAGAGSVTRAGRGRRARSPGGNGRRAGRVHCE
ncbi:MAG: alpha/beta fold hydrolase [Caldilineaceae bacterium]